MTDNNKLIKKLVASFKVDLTTLLNSEANDPKAELTGLMTSIFEHIEKWEWEHKSSKGKREVCQQ